MSAPPISTSSEQSYRTPRWVFEGLQRALGRRYVLDCAASSDNALCPNFYAEGDAPRGALDMDLASDLAALEGDGFCNPPFEEIAPWCKWLIENATRLPASVSRYDIHAQGACEVAPAADLLVPHSVSTDWFQQTAPYAITTIITPRFPYVHPDPERAQREHDARRAAKGLPPTKWKSTAPAGSMVLSFTRESVTNPTAPGEALRVYLLELVKPREKRSAA